MKKYPLNCTVDKKEVFNYPFITDSRTVSYIRENGHVMFIIRGLPYTGKTALSQLLIQAYPNAVYCSAVKYLNTLNPKDEIVLPTENKETSFRLCLDKARKACEQNEKIIIVQNSHIKRFEVQPFLNFAALHDYTVIMIATNNRFEFTPQDLARDNPNGLDLLYLTRRFKGWHDILPVFTGWFISSDDSLCIHNFLFKSLEPLLEDSKFCKFFSVGNAEELRNCFHLRKVLSCIAGYFGDPLAMKEYDLLDEVQDSYGKRFCINIVGYLISASGITGIVQVDKQLKCLISDTYNQKIIRIEKQMKQLGCDNVRKVLLKMISATTKNVLEHGKTFKLQENDYQPRNTTMTLEDWSDDEDIDIEKISFIHLGQRSFDSFDIPKIKKEFECSLKSVSDKSGIIPGDIFDQIGEETKICRLPENVWLVKAPKIICVETVFTGFYA